MEIHKGMKIICCFCFYLVTTLDSFCQEKKLENIKGAWIISNDITPAEARSNAINEAKIEALHQAGVPEYISESNLMYRSEKLDQFKELFETLTTNEISGEILESTIVKEEKKLTSSGDLMYEVWINAVVLVHKTSRDPGFNIEVKGIQEKYSSPDKLTFEVRPSKDGYLNVFILGESESGLIFPNTIERQEKLAADKSYYFPKSKALDYEVSTVNGIEINYLLLLYTMYEISFIDEQTPRNILRFIGNIDPSQKYLKSYTLLIKK